MVARVSMFIRDDRILQNFCWMPEAKWRLQHLEIKIMMDFYETVLADTSPKLLCILGNFDIIYVKETRLIRVVCVYANKTFSRVLRGVRGRLV